MTAAYWIGTLSVVTLTVACIWSENYFAKEGLDVQGRPPLTKSQNFNVVKKSFMNVSVSINVEGPARCAGPADDRLNSGQPIRVGERVPEYFSAVGDVKSSATQMESALAGSLATGSSVSRSRDSRLTDHGMPWTANTCSV